MTKKCLGCGIILQTVDIEKEGYVDDVDKRKILMEEIKNYGTYEIEVKLYQGISAKMYVMVGE